MKNIIVKVKKLHPDAKIPDKKHPEDAGYELYALGNYVVEDEQASLVATGIAIEIPKGYVGIVKEKSGRAISGIEVHAGVIDSNYRDEVKVVVTTRDTKSPAVIRSGEKVAQILYIEQVQAEHLVVEELSKEGDRGGGFGSTGLV